jgi:hypothetical protein
VSRARMIGARGKVRWPRCSTLGARSYGSYMARLQYSLSFPFHSTKMDLCVYLHASYSESGSRYVGLLCSLAFNPCFAKRIFELVAWILLRASLDDSNSSDLRGGLPEYQVMRDAAQRDQVSEELGGFLCFEMEAAGLMKSFPYLVIRGV